MWPLHAYCNSKARLSGKTVVITGANTGIGKETVRDLYRRGARVILACRDLTKAQEAIKDVKQNPTSRPDGEEFKGEPGELECCKLNLASLASVRDCAEHLLKTEGKIHILVNNAGVMFHPFELTDDGFEMHFQANYLGHFLFTLLLLPKIEKSTPDCRIVNVSSKIHLFGDINFDDLNGEKGYNSLTAYMQSKLANILFTKELVSQLEDAEIEGINTYSLHPGVVGTELGRHLTAFGSYKRWFWRSLKVFSKTCEQGAQTTIYCAVDETTAKQTGLYYSNCAAVQPSRKCNNIELRKKLWRETCKLLNLEKHDNLNELVKESAKKYRTDNIYNK